MTTDDRSGQILGVAIAFLIPTALSTCLRVYTRTKILRNQAGWDDAAMVAAFGFVLTYLVSQLCSVAHGNGKKRKLMDDNTAQAGLMVGFFCTTSMKNANIGRSQYWFFCEIFYTLSTAALKISIGLFLLRIAVERIHICIIRWIMILNVLFAVPYCLLVTFQCQPISFWWDLNPDHHGKRINPDVIMILTYVVSVLNSVADWTFGLLPFFIVRKLQMKKQTKVLVVSILGFAALGSTATIIRIPFVHTLRDFKGEFLYNTADVAIWTTVELGVTATVVNIATLRPLLSSLRAHLGVTCTTATGPKPFGNTYSRSGVNQRSKRQDVEDQTLITLDEVRAGGQDKGTTNVVIAGGRYEQELLPLPSPGLGHAWRIREVVQSVEIRPNSSGGSDGSLVEEEDERKTNAGGLRVEGAVKKSGSSAGRLGVGFRGRQDTMNEPTEGAKATTPYERL